MTPLEFTIIALLAGFILATLVFRSLSRIQRQSEEIEAAMKAILAAYLKLLQARAKRVGRRIQPGRLVALLTLFLLIKNTI
jgi:hypothetical protein